METILTRAPHGHILTNINVWSPDGRQIVFDTRSDPAGSQFDGDRIQTVDIHSREITTIFQAGRGVHCGVATFDPNAQRVVFILGPQPGDDGFSYGPARRQGVIVDVQRPFDCQNLDARDLVAPYTPGALRGGTHVHVFSPDSRFVSFTYEDFVLEQVEHEDALHQQNLRMVGVTQLDRPVDPRSAHPRNHAGMGFSVVLTEQFANPIPGSDQISRAFEEGWVQYTRGGQPPRYALAFQGRVRTEQGNWLNEVFVVDFPADVTQARPGAPLEGTTTHRPCPPVNVQQRRLTRTHTRAHPGIVGPRHWLRSHPTTGMIAFLMRDSAGVVQIWGVDPVGGNYQQLTTVPAGVDSAFSWSPTGDRIAFVSAGQVVAWDVQKQRAVALTEYQPDSPIRPEACVFSPNGEYVAYVREVPIADGRFNQVCMTPT